MNIATAGRQERLDGDAVIFVGNHEDHWRVTLRREAGAFTIEAYDLTQGRDAFAPIEAAN